MPPSSFQRMMLPMVLLARGLDALVPGCLSAPRLLLLVSVQYTQPSCPIAIHSGLSILVALKISLAWRPLITTSP